MKNVLLMLLVMSGCVGQVLCSEKKENRIEIFAKVNSGSMRLQYVGKKDIDRCNQFNMKAGSNTPCFMYCQYRGISNPEELIGTLEIIKDFNFDSFSGCSRKTVEDAQYAVQNDKKKFEEYKIFTELSDFNSKRAIPWHCFVSANDKSHFKVPGDELFSFVKNIEGEDITFIVILESFFGDRNPQDDIDEFRKVALCPFDDEEELCNAGIICRKELREAGARKSGGDSKQKYAQGINGYFGEEVKEEIRQDYKAIKTALFWSRIRKLFGVSIAAIIAYVLYQKFHVTA